MAGWWMGGWVVGWLGGGVVGWLASTGRHRRAAHRRASICEPARRCRLGDAMSTSRHRQDQLGSSMPSSHRRAAAGGLARACAQNPNSFLKWCRAAPLGIRGGGGLAVGALLGSEAAAVGLWARGERTSASASANPEICWWTGFDHIMKTFVVFQAMISSYTLPLCVAHFFHCLILTL